jgi:hypothetical protein
VKNIVHRGTANLFLNIVALVQLEDNLMLKLKGDWTSSQGFFWNFDSIILTYYV